MLFSFGFAKNQCEKWDNSCQVLKSQSAVELQWYGMRWHAFDNNVGSLWNSGPSNVADYMFVTFDDEYLLTSIQLSVYGDIIHDPKLIEFYSDENATCFLTNISYPTAPNGSYW